MALIEQTASTIVTRDQLAEVFKDPRLLRAMEQVLQVVNEVVPAINAIGDASMWVQTLTGLLPNERLVIPGTGVTLDYSAPNAVTINVHVAIDATTRITGLTNADDDAAAAAAGVALHEPYMNGSVFQVRQA